MARPDVLLVSLGTTLGWRVADRTLTDQLKRAGATVEAVSVGRGAADRLRRGYPLNDVIEMHAARRAVARAIAELAADPARAEKMGAAGRRLQRERFTGERMVEGYRSAFERAIERGQA